MGERLKVISLRTNPRIQGYDAAAVDKAIASAGRHGAKIGAKERKLIHRLLQGRAPARVKTLDQNPAPGRAARRRRPRPAGWIITIPAARKNSLRAGPLYWTGAQLVSARARSKTYESVAQARAAALAMFRRLGRFYPKAKLVRA
jgi:hypothetical protein